MPRRQGAVRQDREDPRRIGNEKFGVDSTPTFFINGKRLSGEHQLKDFESKLVGVDKLSGRPSGSTPPAARDSADARPEASTPMPHEGKPEAAFGSVGISDDGCDGLTASIPFASGVAFSGCGGGAMGPTPPIDKATYVPPTRS